MTGPWVVVLEMARPSHVEEVDLERLREMVLAVAANQPSVMFATDRYALQLHVLAEDAAGALLSAQRHLEDAAARSGVPRWELVRGEAVSQAEFERDCRQWRFPAASALGPPAGPASGADDPADALLQFVFQDPSTGLATECLFEHTLDRSLSAGAPPGRVHALLVAHLDAFGELAAQLGPVGGEAVMAEAAARIQDVLREDDLVARLSDDRIAVLLRSTTAAAAASVAERLVEGVRPPMTVEGTHVSTGASVGVAVSGRDQGGRELMEAARLAAEVAARSGGDRWVLLDRTGAVIPPSGPTPMAQRSRHRRRGR